MHPDKRRDYITKGELGALVRKLTVGQAQLEEAVLKCATYFYWKTKESRAEAERAVKAVTARKPNRPFRIVAGGKA